MALSAAHIADNVQRVQERVAGVCEKVGRSQDDVILIAVCKMQPWSVVAAAYDAGLRHFGENYVQETLKKMDSLVADEGAGKSYHEINWHLIGHLQSNKVKHLQQGFAWLHTLDSLSVAKKLMLNMRILQI